MGDVRPGGRVGREVMPTLEWPWTRNTGTVVIIIISIDHNNKTCETGW